MGLESELYYFCKPVQLLPVEQSIEFLPVQAFLADEPACKIMWELIDTQFRTRSKFLAIWPGVKYVAIHRDFEGSLDGFLLITSPVNWQIDYVVVRPDSRGQGIASSLVVAAVNQAFLQMVPYVMLTSKESLRPLYEACGFEVIRRFAKV